MKKWPLCVVCLMLGLGCMQYVPPAQAAELPVEVLLVQPLDEARGYCIDVVGPQARADIHRPLQAHACYSYQGRVAVDQGFDAAALAHGRFSMPALGVCMSSDAQPGGVLRLAPCSDAAAQQFEWSAAGTLSPAGAPQLCVTVADGKGEPGNGGNPVHLKRKLSLQACDPARASLQTWRYRAAFD